MPSCGFIKNRHHSPSVIEQQFW